MPGINNSTGYSATQQPYVTMNKSFSFKNKINSQLQYIKTSLMAVNVHVAASYLTNTGFALATASAAATGINLNLQMSALTGRHAGVVAGFPGVYGVVQKSANSANRLQFINTAYYSDLYKNEPGMMYFLIESLFERIGHIKTQILTDDEVVDIISSMAG
ncbi:hypothetical protein [Pantoea stewartii]|uniref:hypothetical protein n=1 Tax=Pantoea stewartii TaxID=66269 RepID=UPI00197D072F|nr:hypothetical protein [Pantoea stewartii]